MAQWPSAMPSAPATPMAAALPSTSPKATADHVQTTIDPLRQDTRARDALPEGRPDLGRPDRLGPRPGEELAARGVRLASARRQIGRADVCLQPLMRTSYPVLCLKKKTTYNLRSTPPSA